MVQSHYGDESLFVRYLAQEALNPWNFLFREKVLRSGIGKYHTSVHEEDAVRNLTGKAHFMGNDNHCSNPVSSTSSGNS